MKPAWITGPDAGRVNPLAAARWRPLAGRPSAASNDPDSFGASGVTKPCSVWKCSGAMTDGRSYSLTQLSTLQETEMRPDACSGFRGLRHDRIRAKSLHDLRPVANARPTFNEFCDL